MGTFYIIWCIILVSGLIGVIVFLCREAYLNNKNEKILNNVKLKEIVTKLKNKPKITITVSTIVIIIFVISIIMGSFLNTIALLIPICLIVFAYFYIKDEKENEKENKKRIKEMSISNANKISKFLEIMKNEQNKNFQLFANILSHNYIVKLKCPVKLYDAYFSAKETVTAYRGMSEKEISCYIDFIEDYFYIVPIDIKANECKYNDNYRLYNILEDYEELEPNYKGLFFKIHIDNIKLYKQVGTIYADTKGNIDSKYSWTTFALTGDSEYKTEGTVSTKLKDTRETEFYYNDNKGIKKLVFNGEDLTTLQLLIPDKEKK